MGKLYLVNTAIEDTWPTDGPILFLGEWCRLFNRKNIWSLREQKIVNYHWDDRKKYLKDYHQINSIYEEVLVEMTSQLNQMHNVNYSSKYWRILIGPWLIFFIQIIFDRWTMLKIALKNSEPLICNVLDRDESQFIAQNMLDFGDKAINDDWNEIVFSQLLQAFFSDEIKINFVKLSEQKRSKVSKTSKKISLWSKALRTCSKFSNKFVINDEFFFIDSLMPRVFDLKVQFKLKQLPKVWSHFALPKFEYSKAKRDFNLNLPNNSFYKILKYMIPKHMPLVYIEGYESTSNQVNLINWPNNPKAIITANIAKHDGTNMWIAKKSEERVPLIMIQHGGVYGISLFSSYEDHEIAVSDHWLSWGWSNLNKSKVIPFIQNKHMNNSENYDPNGGALIVGVSTVRYSCQMIAHPIAGQWSSYFQDQIRFVKNLPISIRNFLTVRLMHIDHGVCQKERWQEVIADIDLDDASGPLLPLIEKSRIYISTYNATTFLESLSWNIPTLIFWDVDHNELSKNAKYDFDLLKSVGIFHDTPESAAIHLTEVWDDIDSWWKDKKLQDIREDFCFKYSRKSKDPLSEFVLKIQSLV